VPIGYRKADRHSDSDSPPEVGAHEEEQQPAPMVGALAVVSGRCTSNGDEMGLVDR
jgi:hypothetical protein